MNHAENLNVSSNNAQPLPYPHNAELLPSPFPASPPLPRQTHTTHPVSDIELLLSGFLWCFAQISHHVFVRERSAYSRLLVAASSCSLLRFRCDGFLFVEQHVLLQHRHWSILMKQHVLLQHRYTGRFIAGSLHHDLTHQTHQAKARSRQKRSNVLSYTIHTRQKEISLWNIFSNRSRSLLFGVNRPFTAEV